MPRCHSIACGLPDLLALNARLFYVLLVLFVAQTINDWYDREIDAINEPYRPIPSGAISEVRTTLNYYFYRTTLLYCLYNLCLCGSCGATRS